MIFVIRLIPCTNFYHSQPELFHERYEYLRRTFLNHSALRGVSSSKFSTSPHCIWNPTNCVRHIHIFIIQNNLCIFSISSCFCSDTCSSSDRSNNDDFHFSTPILYTFLISLKDSGFMNQSFVLLETLTKINITGTSTSTPTTVAKVAPDCNPKVILIPLLPTQKVTCSYHSSRRSNIVWQLPKS